MKILFIIVAIIGIGIVLFGSFSGDTSESRAMSTGIGFFLGGIVIVIDIILAALWYGLPLLF